MMKKILFCITGVLMAGAMCAQTVPVTAVKNFEAQHQQASVLDPVLAQKGVTMPAPAATHPTMSRLSPRACSRPTAVREKN